MDTLSNILEITVLFPRQPILRRHLGNKISLPCQYTPPWIMNMDKFSILSPSPLSLLLILAIILLKLVHKIVQVNKILL